jgi:hypothetical protein
MKRESSADVSIYQFHIIREKRKKRANAEVALVPKKQKQYLRQRLL